MKKNRYFFQLLVLLACLIPMSSFSASYSGPAAPMPGIEQPAELSEKAQRKQARQERRLARFKRFAEKRMAKVEKKNQRKGFGDLHRFLQLALLLLLAAIAFGLLALFVGPFTYIASAAAIASGVFFVLWLIEYAG